MPRTTLIVDARADDAIHEFRRLATTSEGSLNRLLKKSRQGELAASRFGQAWRRAGMQVGAAVARMDTSFVGFTRRVRSNFRGLGVAGGLGLFGILSENKRASQLNADIASIVGLPLNTHTGRMAAKHRREQAVAMALDPRILASGSDVLGIQASLLARDHGLGDPRLIRAVGESATAFGANPDDVAELTFRLVKGFGVAIEDASRAIEILAAAGKAGGVELKDMAGVIGKTFGPAVQMGVVPNERGVAFLGAMMQTAEIGEADPASAATVVRSLLNSFGKTNVRNVLERHGVRTRNASGTGPRRDSANFLREVVALVAGDTTGLLARQISPDERALRLLTQFAVPLNPTDAAAKGQPGGATVYDNFLQIMSTSLDSFGLTRQDSDNRLASTAFKLDNALKTLQTKLLEAGGVVDKFADALLLASEHPKTAAALFAGGNLVASALPVFLGTFFGSRSLRRLLTSGGRLPGPGAPVPNPGSLIANPSSSGGLRGLLTAGAALTSFSVAAGLAPLIGLAESIRDAFNAKSQDGNALDARASEFTTVSGEPIKLVKLEVINRSSSAQIIRTDDGGEPSEELVDTGPL